MSYAVRYAYPFCWYNLLSMRVPPYKIIFLIAIQNVVDR